jgi:leucyl aminopeptidase
MLKIFATEKDQAGPAPVMLHAAGPMDLDRFLSGRTSAEARWLKSVGFTGRDGEFVLIPGVDGTLGAAVLGLGPGRDPHALALFSERLPSGIYTLGEVPKEFCGERAAYAWAIGTYSYDRYRARGRQAGKNEPRLMLEPGVDGAKVSRLAEAVFLARDLINTPPNDMGPAELEEAARSIAERHGALLKVIVGDDLLAQNYPMIHAVGRASTRLPRLIDLSWGNERHPKVTLVGKGVCFDTGGLDLKTSAGMATMKKDMGGAASVLGLAQAVMDAKIPVRLRVLIPAVENSVSGSSFRPGDILSSRKGLTVEIGNTDAEGRLVLGDALADADVEAPELMFCIATLTGAARAATGMEVPPFFTDDETLASELSRHAASEHDPVWRLPLWRSYESTLDSPVADINNSPEYGLAGAITAALFLNRFVTRTTSWAHFDIPAWTDRPKPGRRKGAEGNAIRALYAVIAERYSR